MKNIQSQSFYILIIVLDLLLLLFLFGALLGHLIGNLLPLVQVLHAHVEQGLRLRYQPIQERVAGLTDALQKAHLRGRLLIRLVAVHHFDRLASGRPFRITLLIELLKDDFDRLHLDVPRLGRRGQVAGRHRDRLDQHPVLDDAPRELLRLDQAGQLGLVGKEDGQIGGQDAMLYQAEHLLVFAARQLAEDIVTLLIGKMIGEMESI